MAHGVCERGSLRSPLVHVHSEEPTQPAMLSQLLLRTNVNDLREIPI